MKNKIDFIFFLYKKVFFETTMTIFYITENEENYCMAVAHFIEWQGHYDKDVIWNFYKFQETDKEACFLYTLQVLNRERSRGEEPPQLKGFEKRRKFKFINDYPVEIIDDKDNELDEDIVRNVEDRDYYEDEDEYQGEYGKRIYVSEDEDLYLVPPTRFEKKI